MIDYKWLKGGLVEFISRRTDTYYWGDKKENSKKEEKRRLFFAGQKVTKELNELFKMYYG